MKKCFYLAAAMLLFATVGCGEKEDEPANSNQGTDPRPVASTIVRGSITTVDDVYGIDLDNDGVLDFSIHDSFYPANIAGGNLSFVYEVDGRNIVVKGTFTTGEWDIMKTLAENTVINAESNFASEGDASFDVIGLVPCSRYVGLRIKLEDGLHYGWARAEITGDDADPDQFSAEWVECYYNATAGASIAAGQVR